MSRLHYDEPKIKEQDFREGHAVTPLDGDPAVPLTPIPMQEGGNAQSYLEKVAKLVPSEVIAGYLAMVGFVPSIENEGVKPTVLWSIFGLCLILTPLYLNSQSEQGRPKNIHLIVSTIAFVVWAYATTGDKLLPAFYQAAIGSIVLVAFSLISGLIPLNK